MLITFLYKVFHYLKDCDINQFFLKDNFFLSLNEPFNLLIYILFIIKIILINNL